MSNLAFFKRFLATPLITGSILPSSPWLAQAILRKSDFSQPILELGPGTGPFTKHIARRIQNKDQFHAVEIDAHFTQQLQQQFPDIHVHQQDIAAFFETHPTNFPTIISGIPFAAIPKAKRAHLFQQIYHALPHNGTFSMFQYSVTTYKELQNLFGKDNVALEFVPLNVPPAFVFHCKKR